MLFNSVEFIFIFLPLTLSFYFIIGANFKHKFAIAWLVSCSFVFYGWWNPIYLFLLIGSICLNYYTGMTLIKIKNYRKVLLIVGISANLLILGYFKYVIFFIGNINQLFGSNYHLEKIILPLAISFFTFQQITFLVDAYKNESHEYNFLQYTLFVSFFPQLIAGPIVHHKEMMPQFNNSILYKINLDNLSAGVVIFLIGLFKKVVLADGVSVYANPVFEAAECGIDITFFEAWTATLAYTFQLYFDFSGYSDMAIGIARMFNILLPINFYSPYKALSIIDFWRRWHITLSRFLKDYIYIPLGGNRNGKFKCYLNILITMTLGGLWHGAGWTFIMWGMLHGLYLCINHFWNDLAKKLSFNKDNNGVWSFCSIIVTFITVSLTWVIFRSESTMGALNIYKGIIGLNGIILPEQLINNMPILGSFVSGVGKMPLLGGGTIMGVMEMVCMFSLMFVLLFMPATNEMSDRLKFASLMASFYFTIQAILFSYTKSEFLYFQF